MILVAGLATAVFGLSRAFSPAHAHRVTLDVDPSWAESARTRPDGVASSGQARAERALSRELAGMGAGEVFLVTQDPSSPTHRVWSALTARSPRSSSRGPVRVVSVEDVEAPGPVPTLFRSESLDHGLTRDDAAAIGRAVATENDPKRLEGLARSYDCDFPVAASVLRCKSRLETLARIHNAPVGRAKIAGRTSPVPRGARALVGALSAAARELGAPGAFASYDAVFAEMPAVFPDKGAEQGKRAAIGQMLLRRATLEPVGLADGFGFGCAQLSSRPELCKLPPSALGEATKIGEESAALALSAARPEGPGLMLVDPAISRVVLAHGPRPVSRGALQMAHAMMRPEGSLVDSPRSLSKDLRELGAAANRGDAMALKARAEVERARRLLDRQNWIGWYRRQVAAEARG